MVTYTHAVLQLHLRCSELAVTLGGIKQLSLHHTDRTYQSSQPTSTHTGRRSKHMSACLGIQHICNPFFLFRFETKNKKRYPLASSYVFITVLLHTTQLQQALESQDEKPNFIVFSETSSQKSDLENFFFFLVYYLWL